MRRSEVCGLKWTALDLDQGRLEVVRTLVMVGRKPVLVEDTKSASSRRAIDLDPATVAALKAHRARQLQERLAFGAAWTDSGLVFTREDGVFLRPEWVSKRFQQLAADAGLPRIRLHDLRHSYASAALEAGAKVEVLSKRLGHSKISITQDIYLHVRETADREVADTVAQAILGASRREGRI